jgi:hypothetical protein
MYGKTDSIWIPVLIDSFQISTRLRSGCDSYHDFQFFIESAQDTQLLASVSLFPTLFRYNLSRRESLNYSFLK